MFIVLDVNINKIQNFIFCTQIELKPNHRRNQFYKFSESHSIVQSRLQKAERRNVFVVFNEGCIQVLDQIARYTCLLQHSHCLLNRTKYQNQKNLAKHRLFLQHNNTAMATCGLQTVRLTLQESRYYVKSLKPTIIVVLSTFISKRKKKPTICRRH